MSVSECDVIELEGGCSCAQLRYRLLAPPLIVHCCHCSFCQRETGAAFALNALIEADRVQRLSGAIEVITTPTASGAGQAVARCQRCKVAVWSRYAVPGIGNELNFVRVGTLDEPARLPPDVHIFASTRQPWLSIAEGVPIFQGYYRYSEVWAEASLERRRRLAESSGATGKS